MKAEVPVAWKASVPLTIEIVDLEAPKFGDALIEIKVAGFIHTDCDALSGADPEGALRPSSWMRARDSLHQLRCHSRPTRLRLLSEEKCLFQTVRSGLNFRVPPDNDFPMRVDELMQLSTRPILDQIDELRMMIFQRAVIQRCSENDRDDPLAQQETAMCVNEKGISCQRQQLTMEIDRELLRRAHLLLLMRLELFLVNGLKRSQGRRRKRGQDQVDRPVLYRSDRLIKKVCLFQRRRCDEGSSVGLKLNQSVVLEGEQGLSDGPTIDGKYLRKLKLVELTARK